MTKMPKLKFYACAKYKDSYIILDGMESEDIEGILDQIFAEQEEIT